MESCKLRYIELCLFVCVVWVVGVASIIIIIIILFSHTLIQQ